MKTFQELYQEYTTIREEAKAIETWLIDERRARRESLTLQELKNNKEKMLQVLHDFKEQEKEKSDRLNVLKLGQRILYENIRQAYFNETMPKVLEVLKKYHNKPYGPVLKQKIQDELKPLGVYMYISTEPEYRSDEMHLRPVNHYYLFGNDEMTVVTMFEGAGDDRQKLPMLGGTTGNRLQVYELDQYALAWCGDYVEDYTTRAAELEREYKEVQARYKEVEEMLKAINAKMPKGVGSVLPENLHYNSIAQRLA